MQQTAVPSRHICPGCHLVRVPNHQLACLACWYRLPLVLRSEVDRSYRRRHADPATWRAAVLRAIDWYRANPVERTEAQQEPL